MNGVSDDRTRVYEIRVDDDTAPRPVQTRHLDAIFHRIRPEYSSPNVVDGNSFWTSQICEGTRNGLTWLGLRRDPENLRSRRGSTCSYDCGGLPALDTGFADGRGGDVRPIDHFLHAVISHADDDPLLQRDQWKNISSNLMQMFFLLRGECQQTERRKPGLRPAALEIRVM